MKRLFLLSTLLLLVITSCQKSGSEVDVSQDTRFTSYITRFTSGIISKKDNITIRFANEVTLPDEPDIKLISLTPSVNGSIIKSGQSLVFSPEKPLKSGTEYGVKVNLASISQVETGLEEFVFAVTTIPMDYEIKTEGLRTTDIENPKVLELNGTLTTSDFIENEDAEKMLNTSGKEVVWNHRTATSHAFVIKNIERNDEGYDLKLTASGNPIGVGKTGEKTVKVPSVKEFSLTSSTVQKTGNPYVSLLFSDPLQPNQDLSGLIQIDGESKPRFVIDGNQVQVYLTKMLYS